MLLRIEDIDIQRCTPELEAQMLRDLEWIGFEWDETPRRQSAHFDDYAEGIKKLEKLDLIYPSVLSRSDIKKIISAKSNQGIDWPSDPDGTPHYPDTEREMNKPQRAELITSNNDYALRLDTQMASSFVGKQLNWSESANNKNLEVPADPLRWGDVILARKDFPVSYHLCCTLDDAIQGITHVVRGKDLYEATSIHILLHKIFDHAKPVYHHHNLILDEAEQKLSKSKKHTSLKELRALSQTSDQIKEKLGFN